MKKIILYAVTVLAFFVVGIFIANFVIMPLIVRRGKEIIVPNVCNLSLETAIEELKKRDLEGIVTERRYDQIIEEGKVIIQTPLPNSKVKAGRIINLTVSLGPETMKVPYLEGVDIEKGKLIIEKLGLKIEVIDYSFSDSVAKDKIIKTGPEPEVELKKGDAIKLTVSKGPVLKMPNLTGKDLTEAKIIINKMGLVLGEIKEIEGSGNKGSVLIQSPKPEQTIAAGDTVSLMVIK